MKALALGKMFAAGSCPACGGQLRWVDCEVCDGTGRSVTVLRAGHRRWERCGACSGDGGSYWCSDCGAGYTAVELEAIDTEKMRVREWREE